MKKYNSIDLFKFIMAFLVVAIHTASLPKDTDNIIWIVLKAAVPFYFMAIGFLLNNKLNKGKDSLHEIKDYIKKIVKLYVIWSAIFLPVTIYHYFTEKHSNILGILLIIKNYFLKGEQFYSWPLWYLLCTIYSLLIIYVLYKIKASKKLIVLISIILYIIGFYYTCMVTNMSLYSGVVYRILSILLMIFGSSGRLLQGMLYINLGIILYDKVDYIRKYRVIWALLLCILIGANYLFNIELLKLLLYLSIFVLCISIDLRDNKIYYYFRKTGVVMYFTHMIFFFIYSLLVDFDNCKGIFGFLFSVMCTIILSICIIIINKDKKNKLLNTIFN